jgi:hypothetical protein
MLLEPIRQTFHLLHPEGPEVGCTTQEVHELEQKIDLPLPAACREFLLWMGCGAASFMRGSAFYYGALPLQDAPAELLRENCFPLALPEDAFVFFMHQGYAFYFMRTKEGDDPPVYRYLEGVDVSQFALTHEGFSRWLADELVQHAFYLSKGIR